jgi:choline transporter-like protein 2/4/5
MWCFEKIVKFISKNAYIMVAMKGKNFCRSTKAAFLLILANLAHV